MMKQVPRNDSERPSAAPPVRDQAGGVVPTGDHPLEVAARDGFGPLSTRAKAIWHGDAAPCVTCGRLVVRAALACSHCGQDLRPEMLERMRAHAGPWYVLEHVRPFPGVSLERIIRQIRRGVITGTSIVRGPNTDYQWRFAVETPGLSTYFQRCWKCHAEVAPTAAFCPKCHSHLFFDLPVAEAVGAGDPPPRVAARAVVRSGEPASTVKSESTSGMKGRSVPSTEPAPSTPELDALRYALDSVPDLASPPARSSASANGSTPYGIIVGMLIAATVLFLTIVQLRSTAQRSPSSAATLPATTPSSFPP